MANSSHKDRLQNYFDTVGFERWSAIYDGVSPVSRIRRSVRVGHATMLAQAVAWVREAHRAGTLLDAGCGTGLFSVQMARNGFDVTGIDIAPRMVEASVQAAKTANVADNATFHVGDVETVAGTYNIVTCFDVLVHYAAPDFATLCANLAQRCEQTLLITYAPYNGLLAALHKVGGWFPSSNRRTEIQMIRDADVDDILAGAGLRVQRRERISHGFIT